MAQRQHSFQTVVQTIFLRAQECFKGFLQDAAEPDILRDVLEVDKEEFRTHISNDYTYDMWRQFSATYYYEITIRKFICKAHPKMIPDPLCQKA